LTDRSQAQSHALGFSVWEKAPRAEQARPERRTTRSRVQRVTAGLAILAAIAAAFWCYHRLSWTVPANSDGGAIALQARDMLQGNWLLRGWETSDVSFYTTELPEYIVVELIRPLGPDVIHVSAAATYTLLVLAAGLLARGRARGGEGLTRGLVAVGIMLAPQLVLGVGVLLAAPDHTGTQVPLLVGWLVLDLAPRRWYVPVVLCGLLAWVEFADRAAVLTGAVPLLVASVALAGRALRRRRGISWRSQTYELSLAAAAVGSVAVAWIAARLFAAAGAFTSFPLNFPLVPRQQLWLHTWLTAEGVLQLYGADLSGVHGALPMFFAIVHMLGLGAAVAGFGFACWRFWGFRRDPDLIDGILTAAIVINLASYLVSTAPGTAFDGYNTREIVAVLPLGAVLAGRHLVPRLRQLRVARPALGALLVCYAAALGYGVAQPAVQSPSEELAGWLVAHHLSYGLAGAEANVTTVETRGRAQLVMVFTDPSNTVQPFWYQMKASWYDRRQHFANFIVTAIPGGNFDPVSVKVADKTFGKPAAVYHPGPGYTVMVWHRNLLDRVGPVPAH
jgi:hypothetical protein